MTKTVGGGSNFALSLCFSDAFYLSRPYCFVAPALWDCQRSAWTGKTPWHLAILFVFVFPTPNILGMFPIQESVLGRSLKDCLCLPVCLLRLWHLKGRNQQLQEE